MEWVSILFFGLIATAAYSYLLRTPRKVVLIASIVGSVGYALEVYIERRTGFPAGGYALAALLVALSGEVLARIYRMPASVFIMTAIVPLVPGFRLVQTMQALVDSHFDQAGVLFAETLLSFAAIAMGVALATTGVRACTSLYQGRRGGMARRE